jgi:hypothetical protein
MKKFLGIAILLMAMGTTVFASPAGSTTYWFAGNEEDNYVNPQWYPGVEFSKFFATAGFDGKADLGFATRFGGNFYLGAHYNGDLFKSYTVDYYEVTDETFANNDGRNFRWYTSLPNFGTNIPAHDFSVLIGVADMGFLISVDTNYQSFRITGDTAIGTSAYKSYERSEGNITPGLKWGMAKDLTANGIRPAIGVTLGINNDITKYEIYEQDYNQTTAQGLLDAPYRIYGEQISSTNDNDLGLTFNLGGYTIISTEGGFSFSADLDYGLEAVIYGDSEYTWLVTEGTPYTSGYTRTYKKSSVKGTISGNTAEVNITDATHTITPSVSASWSSEKIVLGAKLELPVEISSSGYTAQERRYTTYDSLGSVNPKQHDWDEWRDTGTSSSSGVTFTPVINLGAQYRVVPNRFFINVGATIGLSTVGQESSSSVGYVFDVADTNNKKVEEIKSPVSVTTSSGGTSTSLRAGMTFFFTDNVFMDAYTEVTGNSFNVFGTGSGSITAFNGIILCLKF